MPLESHYGLSRSRAMVMPCANTGLLLFMLGWHWHVCACVGSKELWWPAKGVGGGLAQHVLPFLVLMGLRIHAVLVWAAM